MAVLGRRCPIGFPEAVGYIFTNSMAYLWCCQKSGDGLTSKIKKSQNSGGGLTPQIQKKEPPQGLQMGEGISGVAPLGRIGSSWAGLGREFGKMHPTASGKPMGHLPGPKTAINKSKMCEMSILSEKKPLRALPPGKEGL